MRDHDGRAAGAKLAQRVDHRRLGHRVEGGRRLVEEEDGRVLEQRPRDADALALAAGERGAVLGDVRPVPARQPGHEVVDVGGARRRLDLLVVGVETSVADVVGDGAAEEDGLLRHQRDLAAQRTQPVARRVDAVDEDAAALVLVQPRDEVRGGGLAGAGGADEGDELAGSGLEAHAAEHGPARLVGEVDVLEPDVAANAVGRDAPRRVGRLRGQGEQLADAARADHRLLQRAGGPRDLRDRGVDGGEIGDDDEQAADREPALEDVQAADAEDEGGAEEGHPGDRHREERLLPRQVQPRAPRPVADVGEALELVPLAREALDGGDGRQHREDPLDQARLQVLDPFGPVRQRPRVVPEAQVQERRDAQRQQGQRGVDPEEHPEHQAQVHPGDGEGEDPADDEVVHAVGVRVEPVDGVGGPGRDVVAQGQRLQVVQELLAQPVDDALRHVDLHLGVRHAHHLGAELHHEAGRDHREQEDHGVVEGGRQPRRHRGGERRVAQHVVDQDLERPGGQAVRPVSARTSRSTASARPRYGPR